MCKNRWKLFPAILITVLYMAIILPSLAAVTDEELIKTVRFGDVNQMQIWLDEGVVDVNYTISNRISLLMIAAWNNQPSMAQFLLENGADLSARDNQGNSVLHQAASGGSAEIINLLIEQGAVIDSINQLGITPLMAAVYNRQEESVGVLLAAHAEVAPETLITAARSGHVTIMERLLTGEGVDINAVSAGGTTSLMAAAQSGQNSMVQYLLDNGADSEVQDYNGAKAVTYAARGGNSQTIYLFSDDSINTESEMAIVEADSTTEPGSFDEPTEEDNFVEEEEEEA